MGKLETAMGKLADGFTSTFATLLNIGDGSLVCEIEVTPPEIDGGEMIPQDCMRSGTLGVALPRSRFRFMPITAVVSWDPDVYGVTLGVVAGTGVLINVNQVNYIQFPNGRRLTFYGAVTKFTPSPLKEGERPTATVTLGFTNIHPSTGLVTRPTWS